MWSERKGARRGAREIEIRAVEEHPCVRDAVGSELRVFDCGGSGLRRKELMQVIIVGGPALAAAAQLAPLVEPTP